MFLIYRLLRSYCVILRTFYETWSLNENCGASWEDTLGGFAAVFDSAGTQNTTRKVGEERVRTFWIEAWTISHMPSPYFIKKVAVPSAVHDLRTFILGISLSARSSVGTITNLSRQWVSRSSRETHPVALRNTRVWSEISPGPKPEKIKGLVQTPPNQKKVLSFLWHSVTTCFTMNVTLTRRDQIQSISTAFYRRRGVLLWPTQPAQGCHFHEMNTLISGEAIESHSQNIQSSFNITINKYY